jgi:hypothetical protein
MGQIVFLNPYAKTEISGGIKTCYIHAELLKALGFTVSVFQPDGPPTWLAPRFEALCSKNLTVTANDVLVFPETLPGWLGEAARKPMNAKKVLFCQNQFYMFSYGMTAADYAKFGFSKFITVGEIAKRAIESVVKLADISVVPPFIDPELFLPRDKIMQIVTVPRKLPKHAQVIRSMLALKYPHLQSVPWQLIEKKSEQEVAEMMGRSTVVLSLCQMEACPLVPLEAMASGCIVVGYHGYGGLEYATPDNGFWFSPEQLEDVTDALAIVIDGLNHGVPKLQRMREVGMATAARFGKEQTIAALQRVYSSLSGAPR